MQPEHLLIDTLTALFTRPGSPFAGEAALHRPRIAWEWRSGQWVLLADPASGRLWGWLAWVRCDDATLDVIRAGEFEQCIREGRLLTLTAGPHVYIADTVVAPWAPRGTYERLRDLCRAANPDAVTLSAHLHKRNGRVRFAQRRLH